MRMCLIAALCLWAPCLEAADEANVDLSKIDRKIVREPAYVGQPHYALFVFGPRAEHRAWLVIDGDSVAYLDRNGNGDLTEADERIEMDVAATKKIKLGGSGAYQAMHVFPLGKVFGTSLDLRLWIRNPKYDISSEKILGDWLRETDEKKWINGSLMRHAKDGTMSQNPLLLTARPDEAQISHFDGLPTFSFSFGDQQKLEPWPKKTRLVVHLGWPNLLAKTCTQSSFAFTKLTTSEVPVDVHPIATLEFPSAAANGKPMPQVIKLDQRCCGDQFYGSLSLPKDVADTAVKVTFTLDPESELKIRPAEFTVPVNHEISSNNEQMLVMFHDPKIELKHAVNALRRRGLDVTIEDQWLKVELDDTSLLRVRLNRDKEVLQTAATIGLNTEHADQLGRCDAQFEIGFRNLTKLLEDKTTLPEVQEALQKLTNGYVYTTWDKQLSGPR